MMDEVTLEIKLLFQQCHICSIAFGIPKKYVDNRRDDGKIFHCPNGHELAWPGISPRAELKELLDEAIEENIVLKNHNTGLRSKLDQAEALLIENGLMKMKVEDPPSDSQEEEVE